MALNDMASPIRAPLATLLAFACSTFGFLSYAPAEEQKQATAVGRQIETFTLPDHQGQMQSLEQWKEKECVVVAFLGVECPIAKAYAAKLPRILEAFDPAKVALVAIDANQQDSLTELAHFVKTMELSYPLLRDGGNKVADAFGATRTPEVFVLDRERKIRYYGRIDDQMTYGRQRTAPEKKHLADAVAAVLEGKDIAEPHVESLGCHIGRMLTPKDTEGKEQITYSQHVAKILNARCVECHRPGEIGPFSLTNYSEAVGWAEMIREVTQERRMPPWHADPKHGKFRNDASLSSEELDLIQRWVDGGAPEGDAVDLPEPPKFAEGWRIGKPDQVFFISDKPHPVPASGEVRYQYYEVDPGFKEDTWIQAAECRPGNREVVHHIIVAVKPPQGRRAIQGEIHSEFLTATAPGARPMILPEGLAKFIPAGSKLIFQMHYTPNGKATTDRSSVGFVYADPKKVKKQVGTDKAANDRLSIPPGAEAHPVSATHKFDRDMDLLAMFPHMHLRGKAFKYTAIYPDGQREVLLDVPAYDFNWQNGYELTEPKRIPAGTTMLCEAQYDNSANNWANPDPKKTVRWGDQTWEEMMIGYFDVVSVDQDLTKQAVRRTEEFEKLASLGPVMLDEKLQKLGKSALESDESLLKFGVDLRRKLPQLDRVCVTTIDEKQIHVVRLAQDEAIAAPLGRPRRDVPLKVSAIAGLVKRQEFKYYSTLSAEWSIDLQAMGKVYGSSVHIPITYNGQPATLNFWSQDTQGFPEAAIGVCKDVAKLLAP
jgi:peroxiredoxin